MVTSAVTPTTPVEVTAYKKLAGGWCKKKDGTGLGTISEALSTGADDCAAKCNAESTCDAFHI